MKSEQWAIKFERDPKSGLLTEITMPADLPIEQRIGLEIPFLESLRGAVERLNATTERHSKALNRLTIVLIFLTVCLVGVGIAQLVAIG